MGEAPQGLINELRAVGQTTDCTDDPEQLARELDTAAVMAHCDGGDVVIRPAQAVLIADALTSLFDERSVLRIELAKAKDEQEATSDT